MANKLDKVEKVKKDEKKLIKLVSRNDYDTFISYFDEEFCIPPRGEVSCDPEGLKKDPLPIGIFRLD